MAKPEPMDMSTIGRAWSIGLDLMINLVAGGLLGYGLDWVFKSGPWLMLIFGFFGLAFGMLQFIREALRLNREITRSTSASPKPKESEE